MSAVRLITLPITGMTCANCVCTVERNLKKVTACRAAAVNLSSERATVEFDPQSSTLDDLIARVERAGYGVAEGEADLVIKRLSDDNDARRLEKALSALEGVLEAQVSYRHRTRPASAMFPPWSARPRYAGQWPQPDSRYWRRGGDAEDAEAVARQTEIDQQKRHLIIGLIFTVPLFCYRDGRRSGFPLHADLPLSLVQLADAGAGDPGAVLRRLAVLRRRIQIACAMAPPTWMC